MLKEQEKMTDTIAYNPETGEYAIPDQPVICFIEGDGIGRDITKPSLQVVDEVLEKAYGGARRIRWLECAAGEQAFKENGDYLPPETLRFIRERRVAVKGPLTTPVGGGIRSLNVTMRQELDLFANIRPVYHIPGVPSPVRNPGLLDIVIFRENTEDVYAGIEFEAGSEQARQLEQFLAGLGKKVFPGSALGIKPMSRERSRRLVRMAIRHALENGRKTVTLAHKGNIMKFTEGAFKNWGYELAHEEFREQAVTEEEIRAGASAIGKIVLKNRIADAMFQELLLSPEDHEVIATTNLNGDYLSDAAAAQVGGLGMAPGANIGDGYALFEATHGTAPQIAGQDKANPCSMLLSLVMMLNFLGWREAAGKLQAAVIKTIASKKATADLTSGWNRDNVSETGTVSPLKTSAFITEIIKNL